MTEQPKPLPELDSYDAGLLNDYGGGNVGWWQDYIRCELCRAHNHYNEQYTETVQKLQERERRLVEALMECRPFLGLYCGPKVMSAMILLDAILVEQEHNT